MGLAGYLDEMQLADVRKRTPKPHPLAGEELTPKEWRLLGEFKKNLIAKRKSKS
jgi:hypothetical protein